MFRRQNKTSDYLYVLVIFVIFDFLLFWPIFLGKVNLNGHLLVTFYTIYGKLLPFKDTGWDQIRGFSPQIGYTLEQLKLWKIPLWNPYVFSGNAHFADIQTAVFYPLNFFGIFLPQIEFWHLLRISPYFLGAFFTYVYLKNLKIEKIAAFFGGLTFGFSLLMITWGEEVVTYPHGIIWLPLMLFFIDKYLQTKKVRFLAFLALFYAFSILSGFIQAAIYMLIFAAFYVWGRLGFGRLIKEGYAIKFFGAFIFSFLLAAVSLLPAFELYLNSSRSLLVPQKLFGFFLPFDQLLTYLAPDFFGSPATRNLIPMKGASYYESVLFVGIAPLIFAILAIVANWKKRIVKLYFWAAVLAIFLSLDILFAKLQLFLPIPFLSTSIPNRILFLATFSLAILAAFGLDSFIRKKHRSPIKILLVLAGLYLIIYTHLFLIYFLKLPYFKQDSLQVVISIRNLVIPSFIFVVISGLMGTGIFWKKLRVISAKLIILVSMLHILYMAGKYLTFVERKFVFPKNEIFSYLAASQGNYRTWIIAKDQNLNNILVQYRLFSPEGFEPGNIRRYAQFINLMEGRDINSYERSVVEIGLERSLDVTLSNDSYRRLINLLGVKFIVVERNNEVILSRHNFKKVFEDPKTGFLIFENPDVMPRAYVVQGFEVAKGAEGVLRLRSADFNLREKVVVEEPIEGFGDRIDSGIAKIVDYRPSEVIVKTSSNSQGVLFLSDNYYPGWKATVDGEATAIWRANYTFRAVPLTPGDHLVRFYFDSGTFKIGLTISLVSLGVLVLLVFTPARNRLIGKW